MNRSPDRRGTCSPLLSLSHSLCLSLSLCLYGNEGVQAPDLSRCSARSRCRTLTMRGQTLSDCHLASSGGQRYHLLKNCILIGLKTTDHKSGRMLSLAPVMLSTKKEEERQPDYCFTLKSRNVYHQLPQVCVK
ncbi:hypothetical protein F2P79_019551 [Pimephales promelas]|nr:hypothetical protein F2P79_019551 [Pimephales promelas]